MQYVYAEGEKERAEAAGLTCPTCVSPLVNPLIHGPCGLMSCRECLTTVSQCLHCRGTVAPGELIPLTAGPRRLQLDALLVVCAACQTTVKRSLLGEHAQECPIGPQPPLSPSDSVACPLNCGEKILPAGRLAHDLVCTAVLEECTAYGCEERVPRRQLEQHRKTCPFVAVAPAFVRLLARLEEQAATVRELSHRLDAAAAAGGRRKGATQTLASRDVIRERHSQNVYM